MIIGYPIGQCRNDGKQYGTKKSSINMRQRRHEFIEKCIPLLVLSIYYSEAQIQLTKLYLRRLRVQIRVEEIQEYYNCSTLKKNFVKRFVKVFGQN